MRNRYSMNDIRRTLETEIAGALHESVYSINVEISKMSYSSEGYSTEGTFRVIPFFVTRTGSFSAKLDSNLNILDLEIEED